LLAVLVLLQVLVTKRLGVEALVGLVAVLLQIIVVQAVLVVVESHLQ
jgi:hypothetical protein